MIPQIRLPTEGELETADIRIAGCRLLRLLEDGGTTRSYIANYLETSLVVVKLFDDRLIRESSEVADIYEWECNEMLSLRHRTLPLTVRFGHRPDLGCRYLVQEYVFGDKVATVRRGLGRPLRPAEAAELLHPVADALVACHALGLQHGRLSAIHVILEEGDRVPVPRLVGLRPSLGIDTSQMDDTHALAALAYALTAPEDAAPLDAIRDQGVPVSVSKDATWNEVLTFGIRSAADTRMLDLRDGFRDVLDTDPCMHRRSRALSRLITPANHPAKHLSTDIEAADFAQIDPEPEDGYEEPEYSTEPTTLWIPPDARMDVDLDSTPHMVGMPLTPPPAPPQIPAYDGLYEPIEGDAYVPAAHRSSWLPVAGGVFVALALTAAIMGFFI